MVEKSAKELPPDFEMPKPKPKVVEKEDVFDMADDPFYDEDEDDFVDEDMDEDVEEEQSDD